MAVITRRGFLEMVGALAVAAVGLGCSGRNQTAMVTPTPKGEMFSSLPWPYKKLDPDKVADLAYESYMKHHCMYGVFNAVVKSLAEKVGYPYTVFPTELAIYGKGGVVGWATLCGALNGAAMATYLVLPEKEADKVINELYAWYEYSELPNYIPKKPVKADLNPFPKSVANSPLCHVSVSNWCKASGYKAFSAERAERCGRLTADVAKKLTELINSVYDGSFVPKYSLDKRTMTCRGCHCKESALQNTRGKMVCWECHTKEGAKHIEDLEGHPKV